MILLYEDVCECCLGINKFDFDGKYMGIGGGNYIVMGGVMLFDSFFFRCLDLLVSVVVYWNNYFLFLYFFLGFFIGFISQVFCVDEGCCDVIYELDIVFQ